MSEYNRSWLRVPVLRAACRSELDVGISHAIISKDRSPQQ